MFCVFEEMADLLGLKMLLSPNKSAFIMIFTMDRIGFIFNQIVVEYFFKEDNLGEVCIG